MDVNRTQAMPGPPAVDPNRTQMGAPPAFDPNRTMMGAPNLNATQTIKPIQCPVCKTFNPAGMAFCVDCGLIFEKALDGDVFGAPAVQLPVLLDPSGREHQLRPGIQTIGRQGDIALEDTRISRRHAQITMDTNGIVLEDLGSTNGTKVNGAVASGRTELKTGDRISLGGFELTFSLPGEANKTLAAMGGRTTSIEAQPTIGKTVATLLYDGQETPLRPGRHIFGRRAENAVVIANPYVSGRHGELEITEAGIFITDTGSTNGTFINDARLATGQRAQIHNGDRLRLGSLEVGVRFED